MIFNLLYRANQGAHLPLPTAHHGVVVSIFYQRIPASIIVSRLGFHSPAAPRSAAGPPPVGTRPPDAMWPILCKVRTGSVQAAKISIFVAPKGPKKTLFPDPATVDNFEPYLYMAVQ